MGFPAPHPGLLFVRTKSNQKTARREKPFRWGFSPVTPSSATTQRGAQAPLWKPPHNLRPLCSTVEVPLRACGAGGESKEGAAAPSLVVAGGWSLGGGHSRKCPPPMRPFGDFSGEGKVTRGVGVEPPRKGYGGRRPRKGRGVGPGRPHGKRVCAPYICKIIVSPTWLQRKITVMLQTLPFH